MINKDKHIEKMALTMLDASNKEVAEALSLLLQGLPNAFITQTTAKDEGR